MRVLFYTEVFHPSIGGLERIVENLAAEFHRAGHEVRVVTQTPSDEEEPFEFPVYRNPSRKEYFELFRWCEFYFQGGVSLKALWPFLFVHRKYGIHHPIFYPNPIRKPTFKRKTLGWMKRMVSRMADLNVSPSDVVATALNTHGVVIPNFYDDDQFYCDDSVKKDRDIVYLGRLVSEKGVDLLCEALLTLKIEMDLRPSVTIIGQGPEEPALKEFAATHDLESQISFLGPMRGEALTQALNRHQIIVVPSRVPETFGIVALEGIACGCIPVVSNHGGLPQAVGNCGLAFEKGNVTSLAQKLKSLLQDNQYQGEFRSYFEDHLDRHRKRVVAEKYIQHAEDILKGSH